MGVLVKNATWQLQEAKNRLSELVQLACTKGAQTITKHGKAVVVVMRVEDAPNGKRKKTLADHFRACPAPGLSDVVGARSRETGRTIRLG